jgi:hypothetical protein
VAQAAALVPAAAYVSGAFDLTAAAVASAITGGYLVSSVLAVRSVIRERANPRFAVGSMLYHGALVAAAVAWLPGPYVALAGLLAARAVAQPVLQRRLAGGPWTLRPVHLGIVEIACAIVTVVVLFAVPPGSIG